MPRMELRTLPSGEYFYYNTEDGGTLSGFGITRLWNTASNLSIYFNSSNAHVDNAGSNVNIYNDYSNCMIWNSGSNVNIQLSNGISTLITGGNSVRINATGNAPCWIATTGDNLVANLDSGNDFVGGGEDGAVTNSVINVGAGQDTVNIGGGGSNITINAGDDEDYIGLEYSSEVTVTGGNGNDTIRNDGGDNVTLNGGTGDDILIGSYYHDFFVYNSGNDTIQNYVSEEILSFDAICTGFNFSENDLIIYAAEGSVRITEAKNKWINIAGANGKTDAQIYFLSNDNEGAIDGREGYEVFKLIKGADNVANQIYAGTGGSSLYGGIGGNDELYGNSNYDEFVYNYGDGQDNIFNAGTEDVVNLNSMNLAQFSGAAFTDNGLSFQFTDGGSLNINGQAGTFILSGQRLGVDYQNKTFYAK